MDKLRSNFKQRLMQLRFKLAWLFYEKLLGKPPAESTAKIIISANKSADYSRSHCHNCQSANLVTKIGGSEGLFTSTYYYYECKDCGHEQKTSNFLNEHEYEFIELGKKRIIEDGKKYRYAFFPEGIMMFVIKTIWFSFMTATMLFFLWLSLKTIYL